MLVYGDLARRVSTAAVLQTLGNTLQGLGAMPAGIERHAQLVAAFIDMGELAQGIADAEFESRGVDGRSPAQDAAMAVLLVMAEAIRRSWSSAFSDQPTVPGNLLEQLSGMHLPESICIKRPEGYAFYGLYPESYLQAAARLDLRGSVRVIGIRSIGTGLSALVASVASSADPVTVRPTGDPFRREIKLSDELAAELLDDKAARFAVVDEGPGLSGSSFGAVADFLQARGVAPDKIHFFPSHANDLGPQACPRHRKRWRRAHRHMVGFDELVLRAADPALRLEAWIADLTGPPDGPLQDISSGEWRRRHFPDESGWPPCHVQQERRKFLLRAGGKTWLLKFVGLGREDARKLDLARALHRAGFVPEPAGYRHGFLIERWIEDAHPLRLHDSDRSALIERLAAYIGFRAVSFPAENDRGASLLQLMEMAHRNIALALGESMAQRLDAWRNTLGALARHVRRVHTDNRLHAWEWLHTRDGRLIKSDALDHHAAHDLVGCQDAAWDLAGASIELDLSEAELAQLCEAFARVARRDVNPDLLAFNRLCYAAFQLGQWTLAADSLVGFPAEASRCRGAAEGYAGTLRAILDRP